MKSQQVYFNLNYFTKRLQKRIKVVFIMCVQEEPTVVQQQQKKSTFGKKLGLIGGFGKKSKRQPNSDYVHTETGTFATDGAPEYNHSQPSRPKPQPVLETVSV